MNYLIISILLNAYLGIVFVFFHKLKVDLFQAIVYNYITCVLTGTYVLGLFPVNMESLNHEWFKWAILMGTMFIVVFNIIALSSVNAGVSATQTSNKLSLIIPVLFSWYMFHEALSWLKWVGIVTALFAILFTIYKPGNTKSKKRGIGVYILPLLLFIGSGIIDTLTKFVETHFIKNDHLANAYLISGFFVAAFWGLLVLLLLYIFGKKQFHVRNVVAGIVLGIPNYFSIYYLIKALGGNFLNSSAIIPINNIGVLLVVSIFGIFVFKEKMTAINYIGIMLTILAILMIYFGDKI